ncbi:MAG: hypothetical protein ACPGQS_13020, partial [Bradymonadia bacterium]
MNTHRIILFSLVLSMLANAAWACQPEPTGWHYQTHQTSWSSDEGDGILMLKGYAGHGFGLVALSDYVKITV